jgi:hypothetical protein
MFDHFFDLTTVIGIAVSILMGWVLKKWPNFRSGFIPIASFIVAVLTQAINYSNDPAPVTGLLHSPILAMGFAFNWKVLVNAIIQALLATGTHSATKNVNEAVTEAAAAGTVLKTGAEVKTEVKAEAAVDKVLNK